MPSCPRSFSNSTWQHEQCMWVAGVCPAQPAGTPSFEWLCVTLSVRDAGGGDWGGTAAKLSGLVCVTQREKQAECYWYKPLPGKFSRQWANHKIIKKYTKVIKKPAQKCRVRLTLRFCGRCLSLKMLHFLPCLVVNAFRSGLEYRYMVEVQL